MFVEKSYTYNGNVSMAHRVLRTEITDGAYVTVASYADANSTEVLAIGTYRIPIAAMAGADVVRAIYDWIASPVWGYRAGG
jgi:hypothetical protein